MRFLLVLLLASVATSAQAAEMKPAAPNVPLEIQAEDLRLLLQFREGQLDQISKEAQSLANHSAALDAYLKACGDQPGCTQPVPAK